MKKLSVFFLILIAILAVGCEKKSPPDAVIIPEDEIIPFESVRIIRADSPETFESNAATLIRSTVKEKYGAILDLTTDWTTKSGAEIVVGNTNRRDPEALKLDEYRIVREGNSIFILGGSEEALIKGVTYFCSNLTSENGIAVPSGYDYFENSKSDVGAIVLSGREFKSARIYAGRLGGEYAQKIADLITEKVGISAELVSDIDDANIAFINESEELAAGECGIVCTKSSIFLVASDKYTLKNVYEHFVSIIEGAEDRLELEGVVYHEKLLTKEEFYNQKHLVIYPEFPSEINRIYDYDVSVLFDGKTEKLPVYNHVCDMNVSRRPGTDMYRRFSLFAFCGGTCRVDIKVKTDFTSYTVFPSAKNFKHEFKDGVISVYLDKPEYFGIQLDDDQNSIISVISDYPEFEADIPSKNDPGVMYIEGFYSVKSGRIEISKPNTTVYIAPGAVLNARVSITAPNCTLTGRGAMLDPYSDIFNYDIKNSVVNGSETHFLNCAWKGKNFTFDGPVMLDARASNAILSGDNTTIRNVKIFSTLQSANGMTFNSAKQELNHCFIYTGENAIVSGSNNGLSVNDVTIGTSNAAIFPQGACDYQVYSGIYVFRADYAIIANQYNGAANERQVNAMIFNNISAMELPAGKSQFFYGRHMGTLPKNYFFSNISIPEFSNIISFENGKDYIYTDNYSLNFSKFSIDGNVIDDAEKITVKNDSGAENKITVKGDSSFKPVKRNISVVNYVAKGKVFVGKRQVFFDGNPYENNGKIPSDVLCALIGIVKTEKASLMTPDELVKSGIVSSYKENDGSLYLTLQDKSDNLLIPDVGMISRYSENNPYQVDVSGEHNKVGDIFEVTSNPNNKSKYSGLSRRITDEIRMYGAGTYTLKFIAKASENTEIGVYSQCNGEKVLKTINLSPEFQEFSIDFEVKSDEVNAAKYVIVFKFGNKVIDGFTLGSITLSKNK